MRVQSRSVASTKAMRSQTVVNAGESSVEPARVRARPRVARATASSSTEASERERAVRASVGIDRGVARAAIDEVGGSRAAFESVGDRAP